MAYRLLAQRGRSVAELRERIARKGFGADTVEAVISRLCEQGFLDDRKLAASLRRYAVETKRLGVFGINRFLIQRGIPADIARETLGDIDETETAQRFLERKLRHLGEVPPRVASRRLYDALRRKGFAPDTVRRVLRHHLSQEDIA